MSARAIERETEDSSKYHHADPFSLLKDRVCYGDETTHMHNINIIMVISFPERDVFTMYHCMYMLHTLTPIVNGIIIPLLALLYVCRMGIHLRKRLKNC
jgi:hypothetical protein